MCVVLLFIGVLCWFVVCGCRCLLVYFVDAGVVVVGLCGGVCCGLYCVLGCCVVG